MRIKSFIILVVFPILFCKVDASGQVHRSIYGVVTDRITGTPVPNLNISTRFGSTITNARGLYSLSIDGSGYKPGDQLSFYTYQNEYGSSEVSATLAGDYHIDFNIVMNPLTKFAVGMVKDSKTGAPLEGLQLSAVVEGRNIQVQPVETDRFGMFKILLSSYQLQNNSFVRLLVADPNKKYIANRDEPEIVNINSFIIVGLKPRRTPATEIKVSGFLKSSINIMAGKLITINANGSILLGPWAGPSGPEGKEGGVANIPLTPYSIVGSINHGALLYRMSGDTEWKPAGRHLEFIPSRDGYLEFQVNDRKQDDNSGAYTVEITQED